VKNGIHFISGLPRSGSTLLAALLKQNPRVHASMSSPVASLVSGLMRLMSQENEGAVFIEEEQRIRIVKAAVEAFYGDIHPEKLVFDTNRGWTTRLPALARLWPDAKVVCCVRNPAWALDSVERLVRKNSLEPSGIFKFDPNSTVYSRAEGLMGSNGMIGFALAALREAVYDERSDRLLLVRFETLTQEPKVALKTIYDFIGEPEFEHDPDHVEQDFDALMFDARIGAPGLHMVGSKVRWRERRTILPPDLFGKYEPDAFWDRQDLLPKGVRLV
jgi:sulfotransferase